MKAILEFQLPEEQSDFELAQKALSYSNVIDDLYEWINREQDDCDEKKQEFLEEVRGRITALKVYHGLIMCDEFCIRK